MSRNFYKISFLVSALIFPVCASAQSWWGDGARPHDWILSNGGVLIRYQIKDKKTPSREYKAIMTKGGKMIEVELGKSGIFDDALPGKYKVTIYRNGNERKTFYKKGKQMDSISFETHPGESIDLVFDVSKKKATFKSDFVPPKSNHFSILNTEAAQAIPEANQEPPEVVLHEYSRHSNLSLSLSEHEMSHGKACFDASKYLGTRLISGWSPARSRE